MKLCFISYARNNNLDGRLTKFIEKLNKHLPQHLPHGTKIEDLTFFDVQSIESGEQWMERLSEATRMCKVCICFYSPPYFTSEYSGREVQVFLIRLEEWKKRVANAGKEARAIVPVIWVPTKPHEVLKPFQYKDDNLPAVYIKEGLLALAMRKSRIDAYNAVLNEVAKRIALTLASVSLPDGPPIAHFGHIASAFHEHLSPTRYGVSLLVLAEPAQRAKPFSASEASLPSLMDQIGGLCDAPVRELTLDANIAATLSASIAAREMPLLVAHLTSSASPLNRSLLQKLAAVLNKSATVIVFSDPAPDDATATALLRASMDTDLASIKAMVGAPGCLLVTNTANLITELQKRISKLRHEMILVDPAARVEDGVLTASAAGQGIALTERPVLAGPGG